MKKEVTIKSEDGSGQSFTIKRLEESIELTMIDGGGVGVGFALDIATASEVAHVIEMMAIDAIIARNKERETD